MLSRRKGFGPVALHQQWEEEEAGHCAQGKCQATHIDCQRNDDQNTVDGKVSEQFNPPGSNWFTHVTMNGTLCADMGPVSISTPWVPDHDCTWLCAFPDEYATYAASKNRKPCGDIGERLQAKQDEFGRRLNTVPAGNLCRLQQAPATQYGTCTSEGTCATPTKPPTCNCPTKTEYLKNANMHCQKAAAFTGLSEECKAHCSKQTA